MIISEETKETARELRRNKSIMKERNTIDIEKLIMPDLTTSNLLKGKFQPRKHKGPWWSIQ